MLKTFLIVSTFFIGMSGITNAAIVNDILGDDFTPVRPTNKEVDTWVTNECEQRCNGERTDCWRCSSDTLQGVEIGF